MTKEILELISSGIVLGTIAGISPGPLLTLVIRESVRSGRTAGIKMAVIPIITDFPIVVFSLFILAQLSDYEFVLGIISVTGSIFLLYLVYESLSFKKSAASDQNSNEKSFLKGIIANLLSPHPYLFWLLIGGPLIIKATENSLFLAVSFVILFYLFLVGSKILVAILTSRVSHILSTKWYIITIRLLGLALLIFAIYFFIDGVNYIF